MKPKESLSQRRWGWTCKTGSTRSNRNNNNNIYLSGEVRTNISPVIVINRKILNYRPSRCYFSLYCQSTLPVEGVLAMSTAPMSFLRRSSCSCCFLVWASDWWTGNPLKHGDVRTEPRNERKQTHSPAVCGVVHIRAGSPWGRRRKFSLSRVSSTKRESTDYLYLIR